MKPFTIIKSLNIFKNTLLCLGTTIITLVKHQLMLQGTDKTFNRSIIPAVDLAAHAATNTIIIKKNIEITTGVLEALIGMMNQARMTTFNGHIQGIHDQVPGHTVSYSDLMLIKVVLHSIGRVPHQHINNGHSRDKLVAPACILKGW